MYSPLSNNFNLEQYLISLCDLLSFFGIMIFSIRQYKNLTA